LRRGLDELEKITNHIVSFIKIDAAGEMAKQPSAHVIPAFSIRSVAEFASSIKIAGEPYL